jgi:hypothetical protein
MMLISGCSHDGPQTVPTSAGGHIVERPVLPVWGTLPSAEVEGEGYRRYGYLLGQRNDPALKRAIESLRELPRDRGGTQREVRAWYAITYLLWDSARDRYDLHRAQALLQCVNPTPSRSPGPFLVATRQPISGCANGCSPACRGVPASVIDLSGVPPSRMRSWMNLYVRLLEEDRDWVGSPPGATFHHVRDFLALGGSSFRAAMDAANVIKILWSG